MSNYIKKATNPRTGLKQRALFLDKGYIKYEVIFNIDGSDYDMLQKYVPSKTFIIDEKDLK